MSLPEKFKSYIQKHELFSFKDQLIIAVSGGVDSVVLCELCKRANLNFSIAHCNFQLRGEESERDETFVRSLAGAYHVPFLCKTFNTEEYAKTNKLSIQVAARELRYTWFAELIKEHKEMPATIQEAAFLLTAHHANDNIETVLMNFFKGTGIHGLTGIAVKQNNIIRPLLFAGKQDILTFADQNSLDFVEDSSNLSDKYTRNFFRRRLLPEIQKIFPEAEANVVRNISRFKEIETLYQQAITIHKKKLLEKKGNEIHIPVLKLLKSEPLAAILYEIVRDSNFTSHQVNEIIKLLKSESGKYISSATHTILKNRSWVIISPVQSADASHIVIEKGDAEIVFSRGKLTLQTIETGKFSLPNDNSIALLDAHAIQFPLLLRKWKNGDYFYPLGMTKPKSEKRGKKKVSKFLVDQKLSLNEKENIYVIESNKKIFWIIGRRIDDRFKITRTTTMALKINYTVY